MSQKPSLNLLTISNILPKSHRYRLWVLTAGRMAANLLDLIGLAGVALLAASFGSIASGLPRSEISVPILGEILLTETLAVYVAFGVAVIFLVKSFFSIWLNLRTALAVAELETDFSKIITKRFFSHYNSSVQESSKTVAKFQNQVLHSVSAIGYFLNASIAIIAEGSLLVVMVAIFFVVNPIATMGMFVFLGGVMWVMNRLVTVKIRRNGSLAMAGYEQSLQVSRDLFGIRREALASGVTGSWIRKFVVGREQASKSNAIIYTLNGLPRYVIETSLILGIFAFLTAIVVFSDLPSQAVTIGVFLAGGLRVVASLLPVQSALHTMSDGANRGQEAFEILKNSFGGSADADVTGQLPAGPIDVTFEDVYFSYPESPGLLGGLTLQAVAGSKTAIVGPSGAGKTTIFELSTGFLEPISGSVTLGGMKPRDLIFGSPGLVGVVPQRPHLATGTLAENVSLVNHKDTNLAKVTQCLERAGLGKFVSTDLTSLSVEITPDAGQLSGGEIQRLGLARALYRDPKILFLDEATSALDAETEVLITAALDSLKSEMTIVLIAHRLSTVLNADRIIYMDKGNVLGQGTFFELKASIPDFAKAVELMNLGEK